MRHLPQSLLGHLLDRRSILERPSLHIGVIGLLLLDEGLLVLGVPQLCYEEAQAFTLELLGNILYGRIII